MSLLNVVVIRGNLTAKPELSYTPKGTAKVSFSIGVNERYKDDKGEKVERAHFFSVVAWKKVAESAAEKLVKGQEVICQGKLCFDKWTDKENKPHSRVYINASSIIFGRLSTGAQHPPEQEPPDENEDQDDARPGGFDNPINQ